MVEVHAVCDVSEELVEAVHRLLPQLSGSAPLPSGAEIGEIVSSPATTLFVARDGGPAGPIIGMLTLVTFRLPTGVRAWVEDVVVDGSLRGRGTGEALTRAALELAGERGAVTVDLTSRPSREAANRLYQRLGFEPRETNVYRLKLPSGPVTD
ncbi:MAG TPA: GNAT family N-acetyltransferase [Acidimicrobiales bacterium]|nr:GNAT family N-acetyltransferase [Acidimicrobiales bacterium]